MNLLKNSLYLLTLIVVFTSCAASYKSINPERIRYNINPENQGISFSYQPNVLREAGNKKLAKKENKFDIHIVAVKIINNTGREINFSEDLELLIGDSIVQPLSPKEITSKIKQSAPAYLLYLLLTPLKLTISDDDEVSEYNVGYALGPGLTALNMGIAASANSSFNKELSDYDLYNKVIPNGETAIGLIGLSNYNFTNIRLRLKN